jgi:PadR family transcriptional regulator, regulatory protein PadR
MARAGLGELERRVLMAIVHLRGQGYAVSINDEIRQRFGKTISLGAVYATVDRLEDKGLVSSRLGGPTPERGGRQKRFYIIEAPGQRALAEAQEADRRLWAGVPPLGAQT